MLDNHLYNLMLQLVQENKTLWRIENHYKKDTGDCATCQKWWEEMKQDKEQHVNDLTLLIKEHLQ